MYCLSHHVALCMLYVPEVWKHSHSCSPVTHSWCRVSSIAAGAATGPRWSCWPRCTWTSMTTLVLLQRRVVEVGWRTTALQGSGKQYKVVSCNGTLIVRIQQHCYENLWAACFLGSKSEVQMQAELTAESMECCPSATTSASTTLLLPLPASNAYEGVRRCENVERVTHTDTSPCLVADLI